MWDYIIPAPYTRASLPDIGWWSPVQYFKTFNEDDVYNYYGLMPNGRWEFWYSEYDQGCFPIDLGDYEE